ncbi:uncharacterized protein CANTADRAFT_56423 [Suhomyces tanzawaensis NRRL Y-17324]|uniref:Man1/Src1 C-terminal domain-containing protein n=1 Tax=Suhomyces tanzawaensis NRRL Y-17324 TaxID=984487 RepID=A0A1E4SCT6_9ASCO|nr:uncharacterized protein CANTADRAFT_56423 [Suhomyces tanzawaensis NRRL Y-17324]ODV77330.1 hypothetical protein CANTADRAFT_56423 [Suhomyces tanzawaensis NRRL Y-17324]
MADENYLEEGFDPHELKVTQLRSILSRHKVRVPSNSKKAQLVELFEREITPNANELKQDDSQLVSDADSSKNPGDGDSKMEDTSTDESGAVKSDAPQILPKPSRKRRIVSETSKKKRTKAGLTSNSNVTSPEPENASPKASPHALPKSPKTSKLNTPVASPEPAVKASPKIDSSLALPNAAGTSQLSSPKVKSPKSRSSRLTSPRLMKKEKVTKSIFSDDEDENSPILSPRLLTSPTHSAIKTNKVTKATPKKHVPIVKLEKSPKEVTKSEKTFDSIYDETKDFDEVISKLKKEEQHEVHPTIDLNLPSRLGVSIQQPQYYIDSQLETPRRLRSSAQPTPRRTPARTPRHIPTHTPKPKLVPINKKHSELSDDDSEDSDDDEGEGELEDRKVEEPSSQESTKLSKKTWVPVFFTFFAWVLLVSGGLFAYWYREQVILIGFCGQEINKPTFPNTENQYLQTFGDYLDANFKPNCTPCPNHARCFPNLELGCYEDFVELKPWNNFIFPNNKKCIPDTKKAEKLEIMIDVALDLLRSKNAIKQCGKSEDIAEAGIKIEELHDLLLSMKAPYITVEEFEELWQRSVVELEKEPEIITGSSGVSSTKLITNINNTETSVQTQDKILRSTSLSNLSLQCQLKNSIVGSIVQYKYNLIIMLIIFSIIKYIQHKYNQYKVELIKIDIIYKDVLSKLQHQYKLSINNHQISPFIGSTQLRDLILTNEHNLKKRVKIWTQVVYKVENNTNVSCKLIENHGEIMKVWQWITDVEE